MRRATGHLATPWPCPSRSGSGGGSCLSRHSAQGPHLEHAHARGQIYREDVTDVLNRVVLIGRLTDDPTLRYTQQGHAVTTFRIAVGRPFANQQGEWETDFFTIVTWRKLAESCANNLIKGRLVAVDGRLQNRQYTRQDGSKGWVTEVVADNVRFLDLLKARQQADAADEGGEFGDEWDEGEDEVPF